MRALGLERWRMPPLRDVIALVGGGVYLILFAQIELGHKVPIGIVWFFAPLALLPVALVRRIPMSRTQSAVLGLTTVLPLAVAWSLLVEFSWLTALAVPAMVLMAMIASRWPAAVITLLFACATAYGS